MSLESSQKRLRRKIFVDERHATETDLRVERVAVPLSTQLYCLLRVTGHQDVDFANLIHVARIRRAGARPGNVSSVELDERRVVDAVGDVKSELQIFDFHRQGDA